MSELSILTTQNVNINFKSASVGERIVAQLLDLVIQIAYVIVVYYIFFYLIGLDDYMVTADQWSAMAISLLFALPVLLYSIVQESLMEGQTLGKKISKIKVIKFDGYQAGFGDYLMRWLFRLIDVGIGSGIIGLIGIIVSNKNNGTNPARLNHFFPNIFILSRDSDGLGFSEYCYFNRSGIRHFIFNLLGNITG